MATDNIPELSDDTQKVESTKSMKKKKDRKRKKDDPESPKKGKKEKKRKHKEEKSHENPEKVENGTKLNKKCKVEDDETPSVESAKEQLVEHVSEAPESLIKNGTSAPEESDSREVEPSNSQADRIPSVKRKPSKRSLKKPPVGYICKACSETGHWIYDCPEYLKVKKPSASMNPPAIEGNGKPGDLTSPADPDPDTNKVFIEGLPFTMTEKMLREFFCSRCGEILNVKVVMFPDPPKRCKGLAYITFATKDATTKAVSLTGTELEGRWLSVTLARARTPSNTSRVPLDKLTRNNHCYRCGKTGHDPKSCTQERICYQCRMPGHVSKDCPEKK